MYINKQGVKTNTDIHTLLSIPLTTLDRLLLLGADEGGVLSPLPIEMW